MGLVRDSYDEMLDELHDEDPGGLFKCYQGSRILKEIDEVAYRCWLNDYSDSFPCTECCMEFSVDDPWESDGVCPECEEKEDE